MRVGFVTIQSTLTIIVFPFIFKWFETETVSTLCIAAPNKFTCLYKQTGRIYGLKREQRYHCISTSISFSHFCFILIPVIFRSSMPFTIELMDTFVYVCMNVCVFFFSFILLPFESKLASFPHA